MIPTIARPASRPIAATRRILRCALALVVALGATSAVPAQESHHGFDLEALARAGAERSRLQSTYPADEVPARFDQLLRRDFGASKATYTQAWNAWWERFRADESGRLEARFHTLQSGFLQEVMFGDAPDRSAEAKEGVTLETYAQIIVALSREPGADGDAVARRFGLDGQEHFDRVNDAWTRAMAEDQTFALAQQYGALYQKYAGADYAAEQEQKLADVLAARNVEDPTAEDDEDAVAPPSAAAAAAALDAPVAADRWDAARQLAFACDRFRSFGADAGEDLAAHCTDSVLDDRLVPVIAELLRDFDDRHVGFASGILRLVEDLDKTEVLGRERVAAALDRARRRHAELTAEFAPLQHRAVPEKASLRTRIDGYAVAIEEFEGHLEDW